MMIEEKKGGTWKKGGHEYCDFVYTSCSPYEEINTVGFCTLKENKLNCGSQEYFQFPRVVLDFDSACNHMPQNLC